MLALASTFKILIFDARGNKGYCEIFLRRVQPCSLCHKRKKVTFIEVIQVLVAILVLQTFQS